MKKKSSKNISKYEPPKSDVGDTAHLGVKGILSFVPVAPELFEYFIKPPLEKRLEKWREDIAQALKNLEENQGVNLSTLQDNEHFITILAQATTTAIQNHQLEKLTALKNAVLNSALNINFGEDLELIFIRFIEELTPTHLRLLKFFRDNEDDVGFLKSYPEIYELFLGKSSNIIISHNEFRLLTGELDGRGLIKISQYVDDFDDIYSVEVLTSEKTRDDLPRILVTDIAKKFLKFISYSR